MSHGWCACNQQIVWLETVMSHRWSAERGILRTSSFQDLRWDEGAHPAAVSDVLRVHEWSYVLAVKQVGPAATEADKAVIVWRPS